MTASDHSFPWRLAVNGVAQRCQVMEAATVWLRLRGLLFRPPLQPHQALWIRPCNSIHMFGMRYSIDVVFLDAHGKVIQVEQSVAPGRMAACWRSKSVLELTAGSSERLGIVPGALVTITR
jgi:uncharacterized protein